MVLFCARFRCFYTFFQKANFPQLPHFFGSLMFGVVAQLAQAPVVQPCLHFTWCVLAQLPPQYWHFIFSEKKGSVREMVTEDVCNWNAAISKEDKRSSHRDSAALPILPRNFPHKIVFFFFFFSSFFAADGYEKPTKPSTPSAAFNAWMGNGPSSPA